MNNGFNILIVGVGGQGALLASRVLGNYALLKGFDCKLSEVHGMSQRGGSVVTHFKMSKKVYSPVIEPKQADILLAFEALECGRYSHYVKDGGLIIANTQKILPVSVISGGYEYSHNILDELKRGGLNVNVLNAADIALKAGNIKALNIVMIGFTAALAGMDFDTITEAVKISVPKKTLKINLIALEFGYKYKEVNNV